MNKNKKYYKDEEIEGNIATIVFIVFIALFVLLYDVLVLKNYVFSLIVCLSILPFSIPLFKRCAKQKEFLNVSQYCKSNGKIYKGKIMHIHKSHIDVPSKQGDTYSHFGRRWYSYEAEVKWNNEEGEEFTWITPKLNFNPSKLKSYNVNIYVYNNMCYVGDYDI